MVFLCCFLLGFCFLFSVCLFSLKQRKVSVIFWGKTICFVFQIYDFYLNRFCVFSINQLTVSLFTLLQALGNSSFIFQAVKNISARRFVSLFWSNTLYWVCPFLLYFCHLLLMLTWFIDTKHLSMVNSYIYLEVSCLEDRISALHSWLCCCLFHLWHLADHVPSPWMILLSCILGYWLI